MNVHFGKRIIRFGIIFIIIGLVLYLQPNITFLGNLPGDIRIGKGNFKISFASSVRLVMSGM